MANAVASDDSSDGIFACAAIWSIFADSATCARRISLTDSLIDFVICLHSAWASYKHLQRNSLYDSPRRREHHFSYISPACVDCARFRRLLTAPVILRRMSYAVNIGFVSRRTAD